eukprot:TRINITY_DN32033_c0_g1_i1.p1 TRINITY_DN32033_c0_g1~~TRINITY_DN32033_c0_g1_i1.p1  ORF type:complete len:269 (+),score=119.61 TRINITY_DN32033_c0_g1_i1:54-860(+)
MAGRRYDTKTTIFSQEGRLYQVEYAMTAIGHAPMTLGMRTKDGVLLVAEKQPQSALIDSEAGVEKNISAEKMFMIDEHLAVSVAGWTADANTLLNHMRLTAQRYTYSHSEPIPVENLVHQICDIKQGYTQIGGLRPFGVSFLYAGWDNGKGFQLYHSDPSGNFSAWKANAIGQNYDVAQSMLKTDWKEGMTMEEGMLLGAKILSKTTDGSIEVSKVEMAHLTKNKGEGAKFHICTDAEVSVIVEETKKMQAEEEKQKEKERKEKGQSQ